MVAKALTIAGSDSGGGAGIQADIKAMSAMGVFSASVITAVTAQNTQSVSAVHLVPDDVVLAQIEAVLSDIDIGAIKIGMLGSPSLIAAVAEGIRGFKGPVVLDPVMVSKSGATLLQGSAIEALKNHLLPRAILLTPNLPEAGKLLGEDEAHCEITLQAQAHALLKLGPKAVLMKGGHSEGSTCVDWLYNNSGAKCFSAPRIQTQNTHGTGCSYSSAIAARLATGESLEIAVQKAHDWLRNAIMHADALGVGSGHGPVHHFHQLWH